MTTQTVGTRRPASLPTLCAALVFIRLAAAFGVPLVNGITHLAHRMLGYVASAQHGNGWIGHLAARYHVQRWVQRNTPRPAGYAQSLSKPALTVGKGAVSLMVELFTLFVLVLLLLLEGPKMWSWTLGQMPPGHLAEDEHRRVHRHRAVARPALGEGDGDQRQRGGRGHRRPGALHGTGGEQPRLAGGEAAQQRRQHEDQQASDEDPAAFEQVAGTAAEQQQPAERHGVGVDDPLQVGPGEAERGLDVRQGDVDDGQVEREHELGRRDDGQHQAQPPRCRRGGHGASFCGDSPGVRCLS